MPEPRDSAEVARGGGAYLALAEGGAVVDLVAAGALAQGLPAAVDTELLQEDTGVSRGDRLTRVPAPRCPDAGWALLSGKQGSGSHRCTNLAPNTRDFTATKYVQETKPRKARILSCQDRLLSGQALQPPSRTLIHSPGTPGPATQLH